MMSAVPWICLSIPSTGTQGLCLLPFLGWTTCSPARSCKSPQRRGICRFPHLTSPLSFLPSSQDHCSSLHFLVVQSHDSIINVPAPVAQRAYPSLWFTRFSELLPSWLSRGDSFLSTPFFWLPFSVRDAGTVCLENSGERVGKASMRDLALPPKIPKLAEQGLPLCVVGIIWGLLGSPQFISPLPSHLPKNAGGNCSTCMCVCT